MKQPTRWDASEHLATEEDMVAHLNAALEDGDTSVITATLEDVARALETTSLAEESEWL